MLNIEEIYEYYIKENHTLKECAEHFNISVTTFNRRLREYNISKPSSDRKRYSPIFDELKTKITKEELENLYLVQDKSYSELLTLLAIKENQLDKLLNYYDIHKSKKLAHKKAIKTNIEKCGSVENYYAQITTKGKETIIDKYGSWEKYLEHKSKQNKDRWASYTEEEKQTIINKQKKNGAGFNHTKIKETNIKKYGVPNQFLRNDLKKVYSAHNSKPNEEFAKKLDKLGISYEREFAISNRAFDFKIDKYLVEINPWATHNVNWSPFHIEYGIEKDYHYNKTCLANDNNYSCIHIWEWDNIDKVLDIITSKTTIFARNCEIREIDDKTLKTFEIDNHLQGYCRGQEIRLGLFYKDDLVEIMSFGKPRYNKKYQYELLRLCTLSNTSVIGGSEKLFKYFMKSYSPNSVISYCDNSKFSGSVYKKLGFKLKSYGTPSRHWYNPITKTHITDKLLQQRGFDQLFKTNYGKGSSNEELMKENGFVEIYDSGQSIYIIK